MIGRRLCSSVDATHTLLVFFDEMHAYPQERIIPSVLLFVLFVAAYFDGPTEICICIHVSTTLEMRLIHRIDVACLSR